MNSRNISLQSAVRPEQIGRYPLEFGLAFRALRSLRANKEDTAQVFDIIRALSGRTAGRGYTRMLKNAAGGRQAYIGAELSDKLGDPDWLARFAPGTVGAGYREFIAQRQLTADGLADESRRTGDPDVDAAHPVAWYKRRVRDIHDVWHVLTGYGTDRLGELCILAFTHGQTGEPGLLLVAFLGGTDMVRFGKRQPYARALLQAWRAGRKAEWLPPLDYEHLFELPLEDARRSLNLARPTFYQSIPFEARALSQDTHDRELIIARQVRGDMGMPQ